MVLRCLVVGLSVLLMAACGTVAVEEAPRNSVWSTLDGSAPLIIAHRGASGYLPEHTIEAYDLAIDQGADVIEPDLVITKDGVLVARHDRYLSTTTNVAGHPEFADRKRENPDPNGEARVDWWVEDFTLVELKTLRARQPFPGRSKEHDDLYEIPTFDEVLAHVTMRAEQIGRPVGVYPETKSPEYYRIHGYDFVSPLLTALNGFDAGPVFIQSFEAGILKQLRGKTDAKLVQLVYEEKPGLGANIPLADIAEYADGVGPSKSILIDGEGGDAGFVSAAHGFGLTVHPWTFRNDVVNEEIPNFFSGRVRIINANSDAESSSEEDVGGGAMTLGDMVDQLVQEYEFFYSMGVDGVFTDFPDTAFETRKALKKRLGAVK